MREVFTIGHSNQDLEQLTGLLGRQMVGVVADVRSQPFSHYSPHFNRQVLETVLGRYGIRYVFLGHELGGRPDEPWFYDENGHVLYYRLARSDFFLDGLARLEELAEKTRLAIMCSEEDPATCHRRLLIGRVLMERDFQIRHIRGDGQLHEEGELPDILGTRQPALFGEMSEEVMWKSTRSVSPRSQPKSSSNS